MSFLEVTGIGRITRILTYRGSDGEPTPYRYSEADAVYVLAYAAFKEPSDKWATYKAEFWIMDSAGEYTQLGKIVLAPDVYNPEKPRLRKKQWVWISGPIIHSAKGDYLSIRVQRIRFLGGLPNPSSNTDEQPLLVLDEAHQPIAVEEIAQADSRELDDLFNT